jgi:hypothetical protein
MRPALFYYCLAQTRAANRDRQAQRDAPARAASRASHSRLSPRAFWRPGRLQNIGWRVPRHLVRPRT